MEKLTPSFMIFKKILDLDLKQAAIIGNYRPIPYLNQYR